MQQRLESGFFQYSTIEEGNLAQADSNKKGLPYQLDTYEISKYDSHGHPIFVSPCDHFLDANMLANYSVAKKIENIFVIDIDVIMSSSRPTNKTSLEEIYQQVVADPTNKKESFDLKTNVERSGTIGNNIVKSVGSFGVFAKPSVMRKGRL